MRIEIKKKTKRTIVYFIWQNREKKWKKKITDNNPIIIHITCHTMRKRIQWRFLKTWHKVIFGH
jgi:Fe-S oxidoreductase